MSNKDLLFEIANHSSIIEMHIQRLKKKPEDIHEMDIDILAEKLKDLYSLVFELETGKAIEEIIERVPEPEPEPEPDPMPDARHPEPEPEPDPMPDARHPEPTPEPDPMPDARHPEPDPPSPDPPKTTADLFTGATTIADSFQYAEDRSIAARVVPQTVEDLKMAIGINDKFLFINELFKGSPSEYNEAIDKLNSSGELPNAETTLNTYRSKYDWSDQSEAYNRLKKIVQAKYMTS